MADLDSTLIVGKANRVFYFDNIRIYLTILVILHHVAVAYGGSGGWAVYEADFHPIDDLTTILFLLFNTINQSYFMALFFLLAGYFTPRSYEKKGPNLFLKDRLIRLGIPILVYVIFLSPLVEFIAVNFAYGQNISIFDIISRRITNFVIGVDHLWFLQALLIFAGVYVLYRMVGDRGSDKQKDPLFYNSFPSNFAIVLSICAIALVTFIVRINFHIGTAILFNFQIAHFTHYAFCFWIGILAYRGRWFENLTKKQAKGWILVAIVNLILLPIIMILLIDFDSPNDPIVPFLGGLTFKSLLYSFWESVALLSISIGIIYIFRQKFNIQNRLLKELGLSAYTAYIIHALVIVTLIILLLPLNLSAFAKFFIVSLIGVPAIFILSFLIRKIPNTTRILG